MVAFCPETSKFVITASGVDPALAFCVASVAFVFEVESFLGALFANSSGLGGWSGGLQVPSQSCILFESPCLSILEKHTLKSCIGGGSGSALLEDSDAFGSGEKVWLAGGLVSFSPASNSFRSDCAYQPPLQYGPQRP